MCVSKPVLSNAVTYFSLVAHKKQSMLRIVKDTPSNAVQNNSICNIKYHIDDNYDFVVLYLLYILAYCINSDSNKQFFITIHWPTCYSFHDAIEQ